MSRIRAQQLSRIFVAAILGSAILYVGWVNAPSFPVFLMLIAIPGAVEAALLLNQEKGDTISESHWYLAQRPLVPFIYGLATAWVVFNSGWGVLLIAAWCFLMAHMFFQSQDVYLQLWCRAKNAQELEEK